MPTHRFRHTLATEILEIGGTIDEAADILGNSPGHHPKALCEVVRSASAAHFRPYAEGLFWYKSGAHDGAALATGSVRAGDPKPSETVVAHLYKTLSAEQKRKVVFPFDHPLRSKVDNNWHVTPSHRLVQCLPVSTNSKAPVPGSPNRATE